jgi:hypothetical protein
MKKNVIILNLTVLALSLWAVDLSATGDNPSVKKLKVPDAKVIFCEALPAPPAGVCEVMAGDNSLLIKGNVLDFDTIWQGGEVLVDASGLIQFVGCSSNRPEEFDVSPATRIECAEGVISPGLINAHDHIYYDQNFPVPETGLRYDHRNDWRSDPPRPSPPDFDQAKVAWSTMNFLRCMELHWMQTMDVNWRKIAPR